MAKISIIIPVLNEAGILPTTLHSLQGGSAREIIVVDGGSQDQTVEIAEALGVLVIRSPQAGRACQMNLGAAAATGEILLFLHADTRLPAGYQKMVEETLDKPKTVGGAFELALDSPRKSLRLLEKLVNWRSRLLSLPYGDQALFLKAAVFDKVGGFANLPIMEDFELVQRLKRLGKIRIAPAKVVTSARRWHQLGILNTTFLNQLIIIAYYLGVSPAKLARWYGRR